MFIIRQAISFSIIAALVIWATDFLPVKVELRYSAKTIIVNGTILTLLFFLVSFSSSHSILHSVIIALVTSCLLFLLRILRALREDILQWDTEPIPEKFRKE